MDDMEAIIDCIGNPIYFKDERYRYVLLNDTFCRMTGKPRGQVLGKTDYQLFPKQQADDWRERDTHVFETGDEDVNEEQLAGPQGIIRTVLTKRILYARKSGEKYLIGTIRDITESKGEEEALLELELRYRTIIENSVAGVYIYQDNRICFINKRGCEILGYEIRNNWTPIYL